MPEYILIVEREPPLRSDVAPDPRPVENEIVQRGRARVLAERFPARLRKRVTQPRDDLREREIRIADRLAVN
jgi:hypothetical protein